MGALAALTLLNSREHSSEQHGAGAGGGPPAHILQPGTQPPTSKRGPAPDCSCVSHPDWPGPCCTQLANSATQLAPQQTAGVGSGVESGGDGGGDWGGGDRAGGEAVMFSRIGWVLRSEASPGAVPSESHAALMPLSTSAHATATSIGIGVGATASTTSGGAIVSTATDGDELSIVTGALTLVAQRGGAPSSSAVHERTRAQ